MSKSKRKYDERLRRAWKPNDLHLIWDFAQHDFARFMAVLIWLDGMK